MPEAKNVKPSITVTVTITDTNGDTYSGAVSGGPEGFAPWCYPAGDELRKYAAGLCIGAFNIAIANQVAEGLRNIATKG